MLEVRIPHRVQFGETDAVGVVFYPNYYRWFDWGTHEFLRTAGYAVTQMFRDGIATPLAETGARFKAPLRYDDEIEIRSCLIEVRDKAFRMRHQIWQEESLMAEGFEVRVCVQHPQPTIGKLRAIELPADLRLCLANAAGMTG